MSLLRFYDSVWDSVRLMTGKYFVYYFQYQEDVGCVGLLNGWFSSNDDICPDNYKNSRFKLKDKCRSEKWEVYLYGDMTIKVMESRRAENCGGLRSCISWCDGKAFFGPCTQVHGQGSPAIRAGKGWRGRRELAPRCSATQLGAPRRGAFLVMQMIASKVTCGSSQRWSLFYIIACVRTCQKLPGTGSGRSDFMAH